MPSNPLTVSTLAAAMLAAAKDTLGKRAKAVKEFLEAETEKLAITLRMIVEGMESGGLTKAESKILLNQQKVAAAAVMTAAEGMSAVAAQEAINSALAAVRKLINGRVGFALL